MLNKKLFKDDRLFQFLDYIFKKSNKEVDNYNPPCFLINRWVSMASPFYAKIINSTTNKWLLEDSSFDIKRFYRQILPTHKAKISYIKKSQAIKEVDQEENLANLMECSKREINLFNQTLEELNIQTK